MDHDPSSFKFWGGYLCSSRKGGHRRPKTSRTAKNQRNRAKGKGEKQVFPVFPALLYPTSLVFSRLFPKGRHESAAFVRMHPPGALRFETHERKKRIGICRPICIRLHTPIKIKASTKKKIRQLSNYQAKSLFIQKENRIFVLQLREVATLKIAAFSTRLSAISNLKFSEHENFNQDLLWQLDVHVHL